MLEEDLLDEGARAAWIRAPSAVAPRACRFQAPSASTYSRRQRLRWMRRWVASGSTSAAALARCERSFSSRNDSLDAAPTRSRSAEGFTFAASAINEPCCADTAPSTSAVRVTGRPGRALEVSSSTLAWPTEVPPWAARYSAADANPSERHTPESSTRRATNVLAAATCRPSRSSSRHKPGA